MPRTFPCPRCGEPSVWEGNEFRPFCSERCKLIDLGAWANDEYRLLPKMLLSKTRVVSMKMIMRINPLYLRQTG